MMNTMSKAAIATAALGTILALAPAADAARPIAQCKVLSVSTTETVYPGLPGGAGYEPADDAHHAVTTTTMRCRGKVVTTTTERWYYTNPA